MKIAIIGAGHAGVTAALEAVRPGADISLFSDENVLPYYRPKITNVAFNQAGHDEILIHPLDWYKDNKIKLLLNNTVTKIEPENCSLLTCTGQKLLFDKIIITTGARPIVPKFARNAIQKDYASTLWNIKDALRIRDNISNIKELAIIGGGVIGIECALRASDANIKVTIIEKSDNLMQRNLSLRGSQILKQTLENKGINVITSAMVEDVTQLNNRSCIKTDKEILVFDHIILCIGCLPNTNSLLEPSDIPDSGILVNTYMESDSPNIYSAGDSAVMRTIGSPFSVLSAVNQGKTAGHNASLPNPVEFKTSPTAIDIKCNDFELHTVGYSSEACLKQEEILEENGNIYRSIIRDETSITGIQMIGSSKDFNFYKKQLKAP